MKVNEIKYIRYNIQDAIKLINSLTEKIKNAKNVNEVLSAREKYIENNVKLSTENALAFIRWTQNTKDEFYEKEKEYYEENIPLLQTYRTNYIKSIKESPFKSELQKILPETLFPLYDCELKTLSENITEELIEESKLESKYSKFMSELLIDFNGEKIPLTILKKYMADDDRETRKKAYNQLGKALNENSELLDSIFDKLVKVRTKIGKKLGYSTYVEYAYANMNRICYSQEDVKTFRNNILKEIVPVCKNIREKIAKNIDIPEMKLYDYDVCFKSENPKPILTEKQMFEAGRKMYSDMGEESKKFINMMLENEAFDCFSRPNKWGGGYQEDLPYYSQPFILANFNGSSADVDVLTHEAGHAFASYLMNKNGCDKEIGLPCMDVAETHSMSMEFFCWKYMNLFFGKNDVKYKFKHLLDSFSFLTYGVIVDEFQEYCYENPNITPKERNDKWKELEKLYRPYMNAEGITYFENGTRWQYQMHIFENPFYYIDYCFAQINALNFLFLSLKNYDSAFEKYINFIKNGVNISFLKNVKIVDLPNPFEIETIRKIAINAENMITILFSEINK